MKIFSHNTSPLSLSSRVFMVASLKMLGIQRSVFILALWLQHLVAAGDESKVKVRCLFGWLVFFLVNNYAISRTGPKTDV